MLRSKSDDTYNNANIIIHIQFTFNVDCTSEITNIILTCNLYDLISHFTS